MSTYSVSKIRKGTNLSQLTNGNHEKTFLRVAIGQSALMFCTSYFEQTINYIYWENTEIVHKFGGQWGGKRHVSFPSDRQTQFHFGGLSLNGL